MRPDLPRRDFLASLAASLALPGALLRAGTQGSRPAPLRIKKAVKVGMLRPGRTLLEKFELARAVGFDGVELDSPKGRHEAGEVREACARTGIVVPGVVDSIHWKQRLSDPDPEVRATGVRGLETAVRDAKAYGATSVLLVPGRVTPAERYDQCYERSQTEIRKVVPLAERLGIDILIENVWNDFLLSPLEMRRYVDELGPRVGVHFDVGNIVKFARPYQWIEILGKRIKKIDVKGYSRERGWVEIGEGDEEWPKVTAALRAIGYAGWATAEVAGGGRDRLADIKARMDRVFAT